MMHFQIGFSRSQSQLGTASLPPHCPTWNATLAVANPWQPHGGRDGGRHGGAIAIPWLAEDILFKYYHGGRMEAAVAASWRPPHGIPIGCGSRVVIRALIPDFQFSQ